MGQSFDQSLPSLSDAPMLFSLAREGFPEVVIHGLLACQAGGKLYTSAGLGSVQFPMRSILKPWQLMAALGEIRGESELIGCASHSGLPEHIAALRQFATLQSVDPQFLRCPESYPMDSQEAWRLQANLAQKQRIFHPCSGKHLAYIASMQRQGFTGGIDYTSVDSPVHKRLEKILSASGVPSQIWVKDSCGLPTLVTSIQSMAILWSKLGILAEATNLLSFWARRPELIGGRERLDTWITEASAGLLIAKEGADGILALRSSVPEDETSIIVKITSGYNLSYLAVGLLVVIEQLKDALPSAWGELVSPLRSRIARGLPSDQKLGLADAQLRSSGL